MPAGNSGTPPAKKLGNTEGLALSAPGLPASVRAEIATVACLRYLARPGKAPRTALLFHMSASAVGKDLERLRPTLAPAVMIWVGWRKKAAKVASDITENEIRRIALPMGFVDVKVCAIDAVWSGLKLMIRKKLR